MLQFGEVFVTSKQPDTAGSYLRDVDIFQDLTPEEISELQQKVHFKEFAAGTVFYESHQNCEVMFFIKKGRVRLYHLSAEGKTLTTALLEPGTFFGEMTLLGQRLYGSCAEAVTACTISSISRKDIEKFLFADARIAFRVVEALGRRLFEVEQRLADLALKNTSSRLVSLLLRLADQPSTDGAAEVLLTHEELAQMLGTRRETVTRILNEQSSRGNIALHRGRITLLDIEGLSKISSL
jgi:CRP/FNR family transcriptional regulator, cyclic AMP receptor protein